MYTRFRKGLLFLLVAVLAAASGVAPVEGHHAVLRFNIEEMTQTADRIFLGRCVGVEETDEAMAQGVLPITTYTFEAERALKGRVPQLVTFRQLGHPSRRALGKGGEITSHGQIVSPGEYFHGVAEYRNGDRMLLFLIPNYMGGKVTYPVGLAQGAFFVSTMPSGRALVRNNINNLDLFTAPYNGYRLKAEAAKVVFPDRDEPLADVGGSAAKAASLTRKRGALPLEPFLELVEQINTAHGGVRGEIAQ